MKKCKCIAFLLLSSACLLAEPTNIPANMKPGDVVFIDTQTDRAYLWLHADTQKIELLEGTTQDRAFRLLLEREQMCWNGFYWLQRSVHVQGKPPGPWLWPQR